MTTAAMHADADEDSPPAGGALDLDRLTDAVRAARANVARLRLQLRAADHDAEEAERGAVVDVTDSVAVAHDLFQSVIEPRLASRRAELAAELADSRTAAVERIEAARAEAEALIETARGDLIQELFDNRLRGADPAARRFRVVDAPVAPLPESAPDPEPELEPETAAVVPAVEREPIRLPPSAASPATRARPKLWRRFLYADVILPLIAALSVIIVLLAWFR